MAAPGVYPHWPDFDPRAALQLYLSGRHAELSAIFLEHWQFLDANSFTRIDPPVRAYLDGFVPTFLYIFTQPDFVIPPEHFAQYVQSNRVISNILAISSLRNADGCLELIRNQPANFVRILTLYSARNTVHFDRAGMCGFNPELASLWYAQFGSLCESSLADETVRHNLIEHFQFSHPKLTFPTALRELYAGAAYVDGACDRPLRSAINASLRRGTAASAANKPDPRRIAILTASWSEHHPVYRMFLKSIRALRPRYHVTLLQLGGKGSPDPNAFDECHALHVTGPNADLSRISANSFQIAFFPDVGNVLEGILLANRRIAPIQVCGVGDGTSTFGADVDYYLAGEAVVRPDAPERDYSERLVLLSGMGIVPEVPAYKRVPPRFPLPPDPMQQEGGEILVNCPAPAQALNAAHIATLQKILALATRPVRFRFYIGNTTARNNDYAPFERALIAALGPTHVQVFPQMPYRDYMISLEEGHLTLDAYPIGDSTGISDALFLGVPVVVREGTRWHNRIGPHMLRLVGLEDCVAADEAAFVERVRQLVHDDAARDEIKNRIAKTDLNRTIYDTGDAKYLGEAFDYLIAHHANLKLQPDRSPIRIPRS